MANLQSGEDFRPRHRMKLRMNFSLRPFLSMMAASWVAVSSFASGADVPQSDRLVILVSVDGLAHHYFDDPKCHMPTIRQLAAEGARARRMECSMPTVTWTNHTTLVTGVHPGRHGVIGNDYFDRKEFKRVPLIPDPIFNKDEIVKVPTIYDVAKQAGLKTAGVIWPASRGAKTLDWTVPDVFEQELFEKYGTPSLLEEARAAGIPIEKQNEWCKAGNAGKPMRDYMYTRLACHIIAKHRPNFLALHLVSVDALEHATGRQSPEAYWAVADSDSRIRDIVDTVDAAGMRDRTTFVITADHGFVTYTKNVLPNVLIKREGLLKALGSKVTSAQVYCLGQGGAAFIYVLDEANRDALIKQIQPKLAAMEGVAAVVGPEDLGKVGHVPPSVDAREPDFMLSAKDGYSFSDSAAGEKLVEDVDSPKGSHGYLPTDPNLYATFVISGAGVKKGAVVDEITNRDVAPTMARLLGLEMKDVDGRVLDEVLAK